MKKHILPDLAPTELMQAMGAPSWNPIPPDHTKWQRKYRVPLLRLWSYMCDHSIRKGRRKGYVCDDNGNPVTVEDAARSLQMDPGFCRRLFREGIAMGLWRRGPKGDGHPKLILNGRVSKPAFIEPEDRISDEDVPLDGDIEEGEDEAKPSPKKVCTYPDLPPYILNKIKALPKKRRELFSTMYAREVQGEKDMHADLIAANRLLWSPRKDRVLKEFGIDKIREVHKTKDGKPREPRPPEREMFVQAVLPGLEKHVKGYVPLDSVQTVESGGTVQAQNHSVQATSTGQVQTSRNGPKSGSPATPVGRSENGNERAILEPLEPSLSNGEKSSSSGFLSTERRAKAEEEDTPTFGTLKALYPQHRFDEGKTKPIFDGMKVAERADVIRQLRVYLQCPRWVDSLKENHGKWIPLSSNWMTSYPADPPPLLRKHDAASESLQKQAEHVKRIAKMSRVFSGGGGGES